MVCGVPEFHDPAVPQTKEVYAGNGERISSAGKPQPGLHLSADVRNTGGDPIRCDFENLLNPRLERLKLLAPTVSRPLERTNVEGFSVLRGIARKQIGQQF